MSPSNDFNVSHHQISAGRRARIASLDHLVGEGAHSTGKSLDWLGEDRCEVVGELFADVPNVSFNSPHRHIDIGDCLSNLLALRDCLFGVDLQNDLRCLCKYFLNQSPDAFDFVPAISRLQPYQPRALSPKFVEQRSGRHLHLLVDGKPDPLIQNQLSIRRAG